MSSSQISPSFSAPTLSANNAQAADEFFSQVQKFASLYFAYFRRTDRKNIVRIAASVEAAEQLYDCAPLWKNNPSTDHESQFRTAFAEDPEGYHALYRTFCRIRRIAGLFLAYYQEAKGHDQRVKTGIIQWTAVEGSSPVALNETEFMEFACDLHARSHRLRQRKWTFDGRDFVPSKADEKRLKDELETYEVRRGIKLFALLTIANDHAFRMAMGKVSKGSATEQWQTLYALWFAGDRAYNHVVPLPPRPSSSANALGHITTTLRKARIYKWKGIFSHCTGE